MHYKRSVITAQDVTLQGGKANLPREPTELRGGPARVGEVVSLVERKGLVDMSMGVDKRAHGALVG